MWRSSPHLTGPSGRLLSHERNASLSCAHLAGLDSGLCHVRTCAGPSARAHVCRAAAAGVARPPGPAGRRMRATRNAQRGCGDPPPTLRARVAACSLMNAMHLCHVRTSPGWTRAFVMCARAPGRSCPLLTRLAIEVLRTSETVRFRKYDQQRIEHLENLLEQSA